MKLEAANDNQPLRFGPWVPTAAMARATGAKTYFTGNACLRGHFEPRAVSSHNCIGCLYEDGKKRRALPGSKEYHTEYARRRRAIDPEWRERQLMLDRISSKKPERKAKKNERKKWRIANDDEFRDRVNEQSRPAKGAWKAANPELVAAHARNRRARMLSSEGSHTAAEVEQIHAEQGYVCAICGVSTAEKKHIDHIMPLALGGSNWASNLQILCPTCNDRKGAKHPDDFLREIGKAA